MLFLTEEIHRKIKSVQVIHPTVPAVRKATPTRHQTLSIVRARALCLFAANKFFTSYQLIVLEELLEGTENIAAREWLPSE